jgi:sulfatase modifying factor 1
VTEYPYGDTYDGSACNGTDYGAGAAVEVGTVESCQAPDDSGYEHVYDLSGNVSEWEDSCDGHSGEADRCRHRGGAYHLNSYGLDCAFDANYYRDGSYERIGFRCCGP